MIGLAKASPTIVIDVARCRSTVANSFVGVEASALEGDDVATRQVRNEPAEPASGAVHQRRRRDRREGGAVGRRPLDHPGYFGSIRRCGEPQHRQAQRDESTSEAAHVVHHALGHPGGTAGVQHVEVVLGPFEARQRRRCGDRLVVGDCVGGDLAGSARRRPRSAASTSTGTVGHPCQTRSPSDEWKMIASESELSRRYQSSSSRYR